MSGCPFECRRYAEQHRFVKGTCYEIDSDGQLGLHRADQARAAVGIAHAVPDLGRKTRRYCNGGETLLTQQPPAYRRAAIRAVNFRGGTVDIGETNASSRCSCMHCRKTV